MREIKGELWDYYGREETTVLITTNGFIKKNGECVMGRGCAKEAANRFPKLPAILGDLIKFNGNIVFEPIKGIYTFPVKHNWWEEADLLLIAQSAQFLKDRANATPNHFYILPRPGCGNGRLTWEQVKPLLESLPDNVWVISK